MVQRGSIWVQNNTKFKNVQNSPKSSWAKNLIFESIRIFWTNIFICKNIHWFFMGQIYSDIHSWYFYHAEYIWIFICPISMVANIFGYSFVQTNYICPTLVYYSPVLPCTLVYSSELHCTPVYSNVLYSTILHFTPLYTILHSTVLYCTPL